MDSPIHGQSFDNYLHSLGFEVQPEIYRLRRELIEAQDEIKRLEGIIENERFKESENS